MNQREDESQDKLATKEMTVHYALSSSSDTENEEIKPFEKPQKVFTEVKQVRVLLFY